MPTCSPEYLLAQPSAKREAWDDIKRVLQKLKDL
jgi:uracil-DNA glycosylase